MSDQATNLVEQNELWSDQSRMHYQIWHGKRRGRRGIQMDGEEFPSYSRKKKQTHMQTKTSR